VAGRIYSTLFVGEALSPSDPPAVATPEAGQLLVIRDVELLDYDAISGDSFIWRLEPSGIAVNVIDLLDAGTFKYQWNGRLVIPYGFSTTFASLTGTWNCFVSGYLLETT
jgi:hypothetical protein